MSDTPNPEEYVTLTEPERELLSGLCDVEATRGAGRDAYCYAHHSPVKWAGHANASEVCCLDVEDHMEQILALRLTTVLPPEVGQP